VSRFLQAIGFRRAAELVLGTAGRALSTAGLTLGTTELPPGTTSSHGAPKE